MNEYRGKHAPSHPWPVASTATVPSRRGRHQKKSRRRRVLLIVALVLLLLVVLYPFVEPRLILTVDPFEINTSSLHLPDNMEYLRVVYISDIHYGHWYSAWDLNRLVKKINDLYPHILILGGDYGTDFESAIQFFGQLQKYHLNVRLKSYGVLGETDYIGEDIDITRLTDAMKNANIIPLVDATDTISLIPASNADSTQAIKNGKVCIVGADDYISGSSDLKSLAYSTDVGTSEYVIFVSHNPTVIPYAQKQIDRNSTFDWFELGLFGHTHGGQMRGFASLLEIADDVPERYQEGKIFENRSWLLVSRGIGTSVVPCRLFCFPQVHCIDIYPD